MLGSVAALALLLVFDYYLHRTKWYRFRVSQAGEGSRQTASVLSAATPKPETLPEILPRLEPLRFTDVLRRSLSDYRANMILLTPLLVQFAVSYVSRAVFAAYLIPSPTSMQSEQVSELPVFLSHALIIFVVAGIVLIVDFVVPLGQVSMTASVVSNGRTRLSDWPQGVRKYFWSVFAVGIVFAIPSAVALFLPQQLYNNLKPLNPTTATVAYYLIREPLNGVIEAAFYVCLAGVGLDLTQFRSALSVGWRVMSHRRIAFASLVALTIVVSLCFDAIRFLIAPFIKSGPVPLAIILFSYAVALVEILPSPLWLLMAFRIYRGFDSGDVAQQPLRVIEKQFCIACGVELPVGSKFCSECGSRQV